MTAHQSTTTPPADLPAELIAAAAQAAALRPEADRLQAVHSGLDQLSIDKPTPENDAAEQAANAEWVSARRRHGEANFAILEVPCFTPEHTLAKTELFLKGEDLTIADLTKDDSNAWFPEEDATALLRSILTDLRGMVGRCAGAPINAFTLAWDEAAASYRAAWKAHQQSGEDSKTTSAAVAALAPPELLKTFEISGDSVLRWRNLKTLANDRELLPRQRFKIEPMLKAFLAREDVIAAMAAEDEADDRNEVTYEALDRATERLMRTPAPDAAAVAMKSAILSIWHDDDRNGYADLGYVAFVRDQATWGDRFGLAIHEDLLRLAGEGDHEILTMEAFSPRQWIEQFEAMGGKVSMEGTTYSGRLDIRPPAPTNPTQAAQLAQLLQALAVPWKSRAILLAADHRQDQGGDPLRDHQGQLRHSERS